MPRLTGPVTLFVPTATPAADLSAQLTAEIRYVIVDQFEAVFTRCQEEDQRREFITAVCELAMKATVILALRADFYDQALRYPGLATALQSRQVVLGPMSAEQVRQAIVAPARRADLEVEDGLVELLLRDLDPKTPTAPDSQGAHEPGALPCSRMRCSAPGSSAVPARSRLRTTGPAAGSPTRSPGRPKAFSPSSPTASRRWPGGCSCAWCTSPTTRRRPAAWSRWPNWTAGARVPSACSAGSSTSA